MCANVIAWINKTLTSIDRQQSACCCHINILRALDNDSGAYLYAPYILPHPPAIEEEGEKDKG